MAFTDLPEAARQAAIIQGSATLHAIILDYAVNGATGPDPEARLQQALNGIRNDASATIAVEWPAVNDEVGLLNQWGLVMGGAIYLFGGGVYPSADHAGAELARALEIMQIAQDHAPSRQAAAGASAALRARGAPHPDDPCDPALLP